MIGQWRKVNLPCSDDPWVRVGNHGVLLKVCNIMIPIVERLSSCILHCIQIDNSKGHFSVVNLRTYKNKTWVAICAGLLRAVPSWNYDSYQPHVCPEAQGL